MTSLTAIRWTVTLAIIVVTVTFVLCLGGGPGIPLGLLYTLGLLTIALAAYAWVFYPIAASIFVSLVILVCLLWAWAVHGSAFLGEEVLALGLLLGAAGWQRQRRSRRFARMRQGLDDIAEELTVKTQAVTLETQTRDALQKKLSRYQQLQSIAEELSNMTDLGSIAQLAVDRAFGLIGKSDVCLLFLIDQERQELSLFASRKRETLPSIRAKHGDQFDRYVLRSHRPLLVNDVRRDFRFTVTVSPERSVSSVIACPLLLGQSPEGVLRLDSSHPTAYTQDDLRFLDILLDLVATAITNAKLFARTQQLAVTDGLTGLTLRRPFLEHLTRELTRSQRSRESVSLVMLDVDHFKDYNDTFGHTAGDLVLKAIAEVLRTIVPPGGTSARYGGEEFAVLLPRVPRQQASDIAEHIRHLVEQQAEVSLRGTTQGGSRTSDRGHRAVTISLGVAAFPDDGQAELELIRVADQRLYQAKHAGRNLVCSS